MNATPSSEGTSTPSERHLAFERMPRSPAARFLSRLILVLRLPEFISPETKSVMVVPVGLSLGSIHSNTSVWSEANDFAPATLL